jgi:magnesium chelatase subunit D
VDPVVAAYRAAALLAVANVTSVVVDCEAGPVRLGLAGQLAGALRGAVLQLEELAAGPLAASVRAISGNPLPVRTLAGEEVA